MRALKRPSRAVRTRPAPETAFVPEVVEDRAEEPSTAPVAVLDAQDTEFTDGGEFDVPDIFRVHCPDCARPIALLEDEETLPEHALCASPWNPFGLTVCAGSGRAITDARPLEGSAEGQDMAVLLTLPVGLDWRTQPFSHAGGPGSRPLRIA